MGRPERLELPLRYTVLGRINRVLDLVFPGGYAQAPSGAIKGCELLGELDVLR